MLPTAEATPEKIKSVSFTANTGIRLLNKVPATLIIKHRIEENAKVFSFGFGQAAHMQNPTIETRAATKIPIPDTIVKIRVTPPNPMAVETTSRIISMATAAIE